MTEKEIITAIEKGLAQGKSKHDLFMELKKEVQYTTDIYRCLGSIAEPHLKKQYRVSNMFLFFLLIYYGLMKAATGLLIVQGLPLFMYILVLLIPSITWYLAYKVWLFRGPTYHLLFLLGIAVLCKSAAGLADVQYTSVTLIIDVVTGYLPICAIIGLSYRIRTKVFSYYSFWGQLDEKAVLEKHVKK
jgi:hypothetical protein